jgi:hypothetical protein
VYEINYRLMMDGVRMATIVSSNVDRMIQQYFGLILSLLVSSDAFLVSLIIQRIKCKPPIS